LYHVRNRNEQRVIKALAAMIKNGETGKLSMEMIEDIYALTLNQLPARYTQTGTIVLRDPVRKQTLEEALRAAVAKICSDPRC
jgi:hypothetical protein